MDILSFTALKKNNEERVRRLVDSVLYLFSNNYHPSERIYVAKERIWKPNYIHLSIYDKELCRSL